MITKEIALLNLFNAVEIADNTEKEIPFSYFLHTLKNGYIFHPTITITDEMIRLVDSVVGIGGEKLNSSFHKSWGKVANAPIFQLMVEQFVHYLTTYGFEALGIYSEKTVYIPCEKLNLPNTYENVPLVVIKGMTREDILNAIVSVGSSGIALSKTTLEDIMTIVKENGYGHGWVSEITNRELRSMLFDYYDIVPTEPVAWLRFVVTKLTGESLLIKNGYLVSKLKTSDQKQLDKLIATAPKNLGQIFLRYKPLFLAMKSASKNKTFFNTLRKKAVKQHKPLPEDYMNSVTGKIKNGEFGIRAFKKELVNAPVWRKVKLAYALKNRLSNMSSVIYRVRNGKGWVSDFTDYFDEDQVQKVLNLTLKSIGEDLSSNVEGKTFFIPSYVNYALPQSEKQFIGNVPANTSVTVGSRDLVVGIHWFDNVGDRVDIDFSLVDATGKFGWDAKYRSNDRGILFSGDMTSAPRPNGASEMFYVKDSKNLNNALIMANWFNYGHYGNDERVVENCKLFVAHEKASFSDSGRDGKQYMVDPNNILFAQNVTIDKAQNSIGLIANVDGENRVYFLMTSVGDSISSASGARSDAIRDFLINTSVNAIDLRDVILAGGGNVVSERPDPSEEIEYIDLSLEALDKTTLIDLFTVR